MKEIRGNEGCSPMLYYDYDTTHVYRNVYRNVGSERTLMYLVIFHS